MSPIRALSYVGVRSPHLETWDALARDLLGMQKVDGVAGHTAYRMDDQQQRFMVGDDEEAACFGWEVASAADLDTLSRRLDEAGVPHFPMGNLAARRLVMDGMWFRDPDCNRVEVIVAPHDAAGDFTPGRAISGFRTGPLGMGHVVLTTPQPEALLDFYGTVLGFRLSDWMVRPFRVWFFHINSRHHSLAIVPTASVGIHHVMVEMLSLDDVGQAYDIAQTRTDGVGVTLGRHTNDNMTSFYAKTPSGFLFECGWGGLSLDAGNWTAYEMTDGPSLWGHDRYWLPEGAREEARRLRMAAADRGVRAPVHVLAGNHDVASV